AVAVSDVLRQQKVGRPSCTVPPSKRRSSIGTTMDEIKRAVRYGRELFNLIEEFFIRATGTTPTRFATIESFGHQIRSRAQEIGPRGYEAFRWFHAEARSFYARRGKEQFFGLQAARWYGARSWWKSSVQANSTRCGRNGGTLQRYRPDSRSRPTLAARNRE